MSLGLRTLSIGCDFGQADGSIRDQVTDKCHSKSLRTKLIAEKDLTLTKLLDVAQAKEASESRAAHYANPNAAFIAKSKKHYRKFDKKKLPSEPDKKKLKWYRCGCKGHVADECRCSKNVKCFKCGKIGHFQSMCRSEKSKSDKSQSKPGYAVDSIAKEESAHDESESEHSSYTFCESESGDEYCFSLKSKLRMTTVKVNDVKIEMVIDSDAYHVTSSTLKSKIS